MKQTKISQLSPHFSLVYMMFFLQGVGTLLPWNSFITLTNYYQNRYSDSVYEVCMDQDKSVIVSEQRGIGKRFKGNSKLCLIIPQITKVCEAMQCLQLLFSPSILLLIFTPRRQTHFFHVAVTTISMTKSSYSFAPVSVLSLSLFFRAIGN